MKTLIVSIYFPSGGAYFKWDDGSWALLDNLEILRGVF